MTMQTTHSLPLPIETAALPVLDLSQLERGEQAMRRFHLALREATHDIGFFYLMGHGISSATMDAAFAEARRFFQLPMADKMAVAMRHSPHFRGYTQTGGERTTGQIDWREQIDLGAERAPCADPDAPAYMRLEGPNLWPAAQPSMQTVFADWAQRCTAIATRLMHAWAVSLGNPADVFDAAFGQRPSTLIKLVRYPGRVERGQGVGAHKDPGVLTLLMIEPGKGGLQVQRDGHWVDVPALDGAFVVNIGELMEFATRGYLKATMHRVTAPAPGDERLSIPFFFNPALDSHLPELVLPEALASQASGVTQDPDNPISGTFGANLLKARLRAHPDVAAHHHADLLGTQA